MPSSCIGKCCVCCYGDNGCIAGNGDDDFVPATKEKIIARLDRGDYHHRMQYMIDYLKQHFEYEYKSGFSEFLEELGAAPNFVKENVMCYYYHNTSACSNCPKESTCELREPREEPLDFSKPIDPTATAHYTVALDNYKCIAIPNPSENYALFCNVIRDIASGKYKEAK